MQEANMTDQDPKLTLTQSRGFGGWLESVGGSLAFTTYQAGKVFFVGLQDNGRLSIFERSFPRPMGLAVSADARTLLMATQAQIFRFDNVLSAGERQGQFDAVYTPRQTWITGDLDIHDIALGANGPVFANTLFNCLATVSEGHSFRPLWKPPFITKLAAEDRCHLNGLAVGEDSAPAFATAVSRSDASDGWRDRRQDGGVLLDIATGDAVVEGLSMPHSPRWHDGKVWMLNSGTGEFGWVDAQAGTFNPITFCPGYARGLTMFGTHAVIGLSLPRDNQTFQGLALDDALQQRDTEPRCGLLIVDVTSGDIIHWVRIEGVITELFDVAFLKGVRCPSAIGLKGPEINRVLNIDGDV